MKFMGHKGRMLPILGDILIDESNSSERIADPFCGSAAVSWFLAENTNATIIAGDLQEFSVIRAAAVLKRNSHFKPQNTINEWFASADEKVKEVLNYFPNDKNSIDIDGVTPAKFVPAIIRCRKFCEYSLAPVLSHIGGNWPITRSYGGYYFSPLQAIQLDSLRQTLPKGIIKYSALAALVETASKCSASPGHTAQPFQPTMGAVEYIIEAWSREIFSNVSKALIEISRRCSNVKGQAYKIDFRDTLSKLEPGDLVFADPPYTDVHYSRFYHVLETIVNGLEFDPSGQGRYPPLSQRPASEFSRRSESHNAAKELLTICADNHLKLVLTFPMHKARNGLSANTFVSFGKKLFSNVELIEVESNFSTLGGNCVSRSARRACSEGVIIFRP